MNKDAVRTEDIKQRMKTLEEQQESAYDAMAEFRNEIDHLSETMINKQQKVSEYKNKGDILGSYLEFLGNQLVMDALQKQSYSIINFDSREVDRLIFILRNGEDILFEWYVNKKKEGYDFNQIEPLHKILKEDYEDFYTKQLVK